ncbi:unnamed protein product [Rotaria sp. Silwood2]|nr:unnamed protein product [Rotaria sp. Silwood2]
MASSSTTIIVSGHNAQWEWEGDKSIWQQYPTNIQQEISQAFDAGNKDVDVNITDEISMTIKFSDMTQVNKKTKFMRRIRLCLELKDENGFFVYEWQNENKKWESYAAEIMTKIADAINNDQTTLSVTCQSRSYDIDLKKLIQTNTSTNVIRKIHRVKSMAKLPSNTSTTSNKRSLESQEEPTQSTTKKRAVSASSGPEKSSVRTVTTIAGQAPVDVECKTLLGKTHVYSENKDIFDCMLNQTNIGNNNNKFYVIQLLEDNNGKKYHVWLRWGRVGYTGQTYLESFDGNLNDAKRFFCHKSPAPSQAPSAVGKRGTVSGTASQLSKRSSFISPAKPDKEHTQLTPEQLDERFKINQEAYLPVYTLLCHTLDHLEQALDDLSEKSPSNNENTLYTQLATSIQNQSLNVLDILKDELTRNVTSMDVDSFF